MEQIRFHMGMPTSFCWNCGLTVVTTQEGDNSMAVDFIGNGESLLLSVLLG